MHKRTGLLLSMMCFFFGIVLGFYSVPIKKGIHIECGNMAKEK